MFQSLYTKNNDIINQLIPLKKLSRKEVRFKAKPWITSGLKTSIYKKNQLFKNYLKQRNENALWKYKAYRNKLFSLLKISKENYGIINPTLKTAYITPKPLGKELEN